MPSSFENPGDFRGATIFQGNHFHGVVPAEVRQAELAAAVALFGRLPTDAVPPPAPLPARSWMRVARNPLFVGRQQDLRHLAQATRAGDVAAVGQIAGATGLGGIGKTQLAAEFVHRYGQFFAGGVCWLSFAEAADVPGEVARCGGRGGMALHEDYEAMPQAEQIALVLSAWCNPLPRLLVFDNCEDPGLLDTWRPPYGACHLLLTSRRSTWPASTGVRPLALGTLAPAESMALLRKHRPDLAPEDAGLAAIAAALGHLPLALHLAGSYLERYQHDPEGQTAAYLAELRRPDLLAHTSLIGGDHSPTGHVLHVANTFALSWRRLDPADGTDALARAALFRAACFAPGEAIPRALLRLSLGGQEEEEARRTSDALARAAALGLVEQRADGGLVLHRLLAAFLRQEAGAGLVETREAVEAALLSEANRLNAAGLPAPLTAWQGQLRYVAEAAEAAQSALASGLLNELGFHLNMAADLARARAVYERALRLDEAAFGPDHPKVAIRENNLGSVLHDLGDQEGARAAFERALRLDEAAFGPDHPKVAIRANNLGSVLRALGDLAGARAAYERALRLDEAAFGPDHPNVARDVNNLGSVLHDLGDLEGARAAFERALRLNEAAFGSDHPNVATCVSNLGSVLGDLGDLAGARVAFERALRLDEAAFGPDHPNVANRVKNMGSVLQHLGDLAAARAAYERALRIFSATLPAGHAMISIVERILASLGPDA